jgi:hypothetical protein
MAPACPEALGLLVTAPVITDQLERHGLGTWALAAMHSCPSAPVLWFELGQEPAGSRVMVASRVSVVTWFRDHKNPWPRALADLRGFFESPSGTTSSARHPQEIDRVAQALGASTKSRAAALAQLRAMLTPRGAPRAFH